MIKTMKEKNIEHLALSQSYWTGCGIIKIHFTTFVHSESPSNHVCGIAIALIPHACSSWEAAGSVFYPISECIIRNQFKIHLLYASVIAIYAPSTLSLPMQKPVCNWITSTTCSKKSCSLFHPETWSSSWVTIMLELITTLCGIIQ